VSNIIDVSGMSTLSESLKAVQVKGTVTATCVLDDEEREQPGLLDTVWRICSVRGVILGSKRQSEDMAKFVQEKGVSLLTRRFLDSMRLRRRIS
jgi:D-arabinose 1-dehydrogenase-like Zn-dependent alcohol dehydrogenase